MRVIAGSAKGTRLRAPEGKGSRPVLDRVKESWFSSIAGRIRGARVLDLYAGVGSLGMEALSRGAASCVFVERDAECARLLDDNLDRAHLKEFSTVKQCYAELAASDLVTAREEFDLIFVDPPFSDTARPDYLRGDPASTRLADLAAASGLVMVRREADRKARRGARARRASVDVVAPPAPKGLRFVTRRVWGRNEVLFYERHVADISSG